MDERCACVRIIALRRSVDQSDPFTDALRLDAKDVELRLYGMAPDFSDTRNGAWYAGIITSPDQLCATIQASIVCASGGNFLIVCRKRRTPVPARPVTCKNIRRARITAAVHNL
jgi:hypothetical protein